MSSQRELGNVDHSELLVSGDPDQREIDSRRMTFAFLLFTNFWMTADYSVFPAALGFVKSDLQLTDQEMGYAGSLVYTGLMFGSIAAGPLLSFKPQLVVQLGLFGSAASTLLTAVAWSKRVVFFARFLVGVMHAPMYVYASVWVDTFAPTGTETRWMGILSTVGPVGNLFSYAVTAFLVFGLDLSWRCSFGYIAVIVTVCAVGVGAVPARLFKVDEHSGSAHGCSGFVALRPYVPFWLLCLVPCCGYYASCGAQYWAEDMLIHMGVPEREAPYKFLTIGVLGPTLGMAVSGPLFDCLGGYRNRRRCMWVCAAFIFLTFPCAPWLLYGEDVDSMMGAVLYAMFLFGLVIPPIQGLVMDSVPANQKPHASAVYGFLTDALGFMLAPSVIGVATDWWGIETGWRWAFYPALCSPWILLAVISLEGRLDEGYDPENNEVYSAQDDAVHDAPLPAAFSSAYSDAPLPGAYSSAYSGAD
jgi:MFS family permease